MIREIIGTKRDLAPAQVADWSFAREAVKGINGTQ